jgi:hypothetical protein
LDNNGQRAALRLNCYVALDPTATSNLPGGDQPRHDHVPQFEKKPRRLGRGLCKVEDSRRPSPREESGGCAPRYSMRVPIELQLKFM